MNLAACINPDTGRIDAELAIPVRPPFERLQPIDEGIVFEKPKPPKLGTANRRMYDFLLEHPGSTASQVRKALGMSLNDVGPALFMMKGRGVLAREGEDGSYRWRVA